MKVWTKKTNGCVTKKPHLWFYNGLWHCCFGPFCRIYKTETAKESYKAWINDMTPYDL